MTARDATPTQSALGDRAERPRVNYAASFTREQWPAFFARINDGTERPCTVHACRRGRRIDTLARTLKRIDYSPADDEITITLNRTCSGPAGVVVRRIAHPRRVEVVGRDEMPYRIDIIDRDGACTRVELRTP